MKKTLLFALFCGFVLNNGYCFDEEHKITNEYLIGSIKGLREERVPDLEQSGNSADQLSRDDRRRAGAVLGIEDILRNACRFAGEFLKTLIPSGEDKGKIVGELLIEHKLSNDHMQMICDDSVKYHVADSGDHVTFRICRLRGKPAKIVIGANGYLELIARDALRAICDDCEKFGNGYKLYLH